MVNKAHENRVRRAADRQGLKLEKSRARDPRALTFGGYQLVDLETGGVVYGRGNAGRGYAADLEGVESYLEEGRR